jgi:hypothetical protein
MKENWAKSLKQKMAGFQQPVDDALWAVIVRKSARSGARWRPWLVAGFSAAAAVVALVLFLHKEPVTESFTNVSEKTAMAVIADTPPVDEVIVDDTPTLHGNRPIRRMQNISAHPSIETEESFPQESGDDNDTIAQVELSPREESANVDESAEDEWVTIIEDESTPSRGRVKFTTSLYAQASPFGNRHPASSAQSYDAQPEPPPERTTTPNNPQGDGATSSDGETDSGDSHDNQGETKALGRSVKKAQTQSTTASSEWTHAFPVQIGARVSLFWSERWSIDTGLTFMHFNSWNASTQQRMEYLGIPLNVNYVIGSARNFSFYASAGGQAFKCFAGNAPDKPWLFSIGLGVGAEYFFSPLVSMYAEPGADWYFHTGESRNYYTDHPFALSLSLGIRLHF